MRLWTWADSSWRWAPIATALLLLASDPSAAELLTFEFVGTIDYVDESAGLLDPSIQVGSVVTGAYVIDSNNGGSGIDTGIGTGYIGVGVPPGTLSLAVEGIEYTNPIGVFVSDGRLFRNSQFVDAWTAITNGAADTTDAAIVFYDSTATKLSNESFFVNQTDDGWDTAEVWLTYFLDNGDGSTTPIRLATASIVQDAPPSVPSLGSVGLVLMSMSALCAGMRAMRPTAPGPGSSRTV